ncbi:MAG TPA: hypothetical protein VHW72_12850, partial [Candidatus Angelobacter sp.]|nr:hypothetical protein [Candidatus Angelobacter sp.]
GATLKRCTLQNLETGEEIEAQPHEPKDGESFIHGVEAFGTWAEDGDDSVPDEILDQISFSGIGLNEFMPPDIKEFLQGYALLRTVFTHVDPVTREAEYTHKQIAKECNEWLQNNPALTKDDLSCLKTYLRKQAYPKVHLHNLLQDMRGKTFFDLSKAFLSGAYSAPPPILTP